MILAALCCALQVAAAVPRTLPVLVGDRRRVVPLVSHPEGGMAMRADLLSEAIGGQFVADGGSRYHLQIASATIHVEIGSAFVRLESDTLPLSAPIYRKSGIVFVPFAFASELLPRVVSGVMYDGDRGELRRFGDVTARRAAPAPAPTRMPTASLPDAGRSAGGRSRVVVIDAGHGGVDRGMSGPIGATRKVFEKDITLAVAREVKAELERRGIRVVMTRNSDTLIALHHRGRIANQAKGDLFLSVHVNAANPRWKQPGGARGFETYFLAEAKTEDERRVEAMENEVIKFETDAETARDDPLGFIIRDMAQNEHLRESSRLADLVQSGLRKVHPGPNRGVKQAGFMVLVQAFMPAVLVEVGFGSNSSESAYMSNPASQRELANALADAVETFLAQYERKVGGGTS
ncbi:MAG: N-acetylmuramoyl-L-alanine amidase [Gemmatimonas sp.]